jgi:hypothetical protein
MAPLVDGSNIELPEYCGRGLLILEADGPNAGDKPPSVGMWCMVLVGLGSFCVSKVIPRAV